MAISEEILKQQSPNPEQTTVFESGNEMAAEAAAQIDYHLMGYFPITPSTEIAQLLDTMKVQGKHNIQLVAADGEHGSAGICYGAALAGARVFNATSANGFMYMLEQLPVQSGTRFPMVMNLVNRAISGPLNIHGDHSDLYYALNTGWVILTASSPQAVYDMNIMALRLSEHEDVRLPVIVSYDGFFTSHQKRKVRKFTHKETVQSFVGPRNVNYDNVVDPANPISIGAHMNGTDLMNNHYQLHKAMEAAHGVYQQIAEEYRELSGRSYPVLEQYCMEDAEIALFALNSAAESSKDVVDKLRSQGIKAGMIRPNIIRPFPAAELREAFRNVKAVIVAERADSYGAQGGTLTHEVRSALYTMTEKPRILSRVFGLGGKDFYAEDATAMFQFALDAIAGKEVADFDYFGVHPGVEEKVPPKIMEPMYGDAFKTGLIQITETPGEPLKVKVPPLRSLTRKPKRLAPGHGACPGCGFVPGIELFMKGVEGDVVVLFQTGCAYVTTASYPYTSHKQTFVHNLFQNGAATVSGMVEAFLEMKKRGELPVAVSDDLTFIMITGDGGMDIGMGPSIGAALRNHKMIILEYDNEGYMNTGSQLSYSTPLGHMTSTSGVGKYQKGKMSHHKDTAQIMASTNIPYVFTATEAFPQDLIMKAAKAQWYAQHEGLAYGKILCACPLNWKAEDQKGTRNVEAAVNSCFFPIYEVERGVTNITYNPETKMKQIEVRDWLKLMGKSKHLLNDEELLAEFEQEVMRRWEKLKAKHENPLL